MEKQSNSQLPKFTAHTAQGDVTLEVAARHRTDQLRAIMQSVCVERSSGHVSFSIDHSLDEPSPFVSGETVTWVKELFRLNLWYAPLFGVFCEATTYPVGDDAQELQSTQRYPCRNGRHLLMTRVWMLQNFARVPLNCFVTAEEAFEITEYFFQSTGGCWPSVPWLTWKELQWSFFLTPEDEWPNEHEPPIRPAWQVPLPEFETLRQQGKDWNDYF